MDRRKKISWTTIWALLGLMLLGCLFIFHSYLFGNEVMVYGGVGSDTRQQYIMWYNGIVNRLRAGDIAGWDFHNGLGISQMENNLTAPFNLLIYLIGTLLGPERIAGAMVYVQILKVLLCGLFAYLFLSEYPFREEAKLISSFLYAFNGYLMVWGQHYMMGSVLVFLPLLLLAIERTIKNARGRLPDPYDPEGEAAKKVRGRYITPAAFGVALMSAVIILSGYYQGYMVMLGFGIYVIIRVLLYENGPGKERLRMFATIALFMVLGVLMASVALFPQIAALSASSRLDSNASIFAKIRANLSLWDREYYRTVLYRFFGNNLQGSGNAFLGYGNYYEAANLFFSALFIFLFFQYIFLIPRQKCNARRKLTQYLGILVGAFMLFVQLGSLIFNGFAYAFSRHTFLFMPFFALICAWTLSDILEKRRVSWVALVLATIGTTAVYVKAYGNYDNGYYETNALILLVGGLVIAWTLMQMDRDKMDQAVLVNILAAAVFVTVIADAAVGYRERDTIKKTDANYFAETYSGNTTAALDWIREEEKENGTFYRVEKDYSNAAYYLESLAQDYRGVSTYNSTLNDNVFKFVCTLWPQLLTGYDLNHYTYRNTIHDTTMGDLVGVTYLLTRNDDLDLDGYEMVHQEGNVYVYRNNNAHGIGSFYEKSMTENEYRKLDGDLDVWDLLPEVVITDGNTDLELAGMQEEEYREVEAKGILDTTGLDLRTYHMLDDGVSMEGTGVLSLPLDPEKTGEWNFVTAEFDVETDGTAPIYIYTNDRRAYEYNNTGKNHYRINVPAGTEAITLEHAYGGSILLSGLRFYGSNRTRTFSEAGTVTVDEPKKDSLVTGTVEASVPGIVMLAIPYQKGWTVTVDGEKTDLLRGDYGFLAFQVAAGTHSIKATFTPPLLKMSVIISLAACLLWLVGWIMSLIRTGVERHRKRKAAKKAEDETIDAMTGGAESDSAYGAAENGAEAGSGTEPEFGTGFGGEAGPGTEPGYGAGFGAESDSAYGEDSTPADSGFGGEGDSAYGVAEEAAGEAAEGSEPSEFGETGNTGTAFGGDTAPADPGFGAEPDFGAEAGSGTEPEFSAGFGAESDSGDSTPEEPSGEEAGREDVF